MRVQHNISAINANRNLTGNNSAVSKSLEKLSSGYRINRAGDDAAGLAISEKMRAQISGLTQAETNCNDGVSLIQTAEGALTEVHSMLNRMVELAEQSANGTYDNDTDRANLQAEVDQLKSEIDRISESTNFNGIKLLDGSLSNAGGVESIKYETGTKIAAGADVTATAQKSEFTVEAGTKDKDGTITIDYKDAEGKAQSLTVNYKDAAGTTSPTTTGALVADELTKALGSNYEVTVNAGAITISSAEKGSNSFEILRVTQNKDIAGTTTNNPAATNTAGVDAAFTVDMSGVAAITDATENNKFEIDGAKFQVVELGKEADTGYKALYVDSLTGIAASDISQVADQLKNNYGYNVKAEGTNLVFAKAKGSTSGGLTLQIGDTSDEFNKLTVKVDSMDTKNLGISGVDISTQAGAADAVSVVKDAINKVSSTRGALGAMQNRLEHTINNLSVANENITNAESRIRDTDMAKEMMTYTSKNILAQAAQSMLAQANQQPQQVLSLLQ